MNGGHQETAPESYVRARIHTSPPEEFVTRERTSNRMMSHLAAHMEK
jgi:hypothetical protein